MHNTKTIIVTGPESSGKTILTNQLSDYFETNSLSEYSREYLRGIGTNYTQEDLLVIAKEQLKRQVAAASEQTGKYLFCDTGLLVIKVWSQYRFNAVDPWIEKNLATQKVDLYILCNCDIPWEYDELRENPNDRHLLFNRYKKELEEHNLNYIVVEGRHTNRLNSSINAIESLV